MCICDLIKENSFLKCWAFFWNGLHWWHHQKRNCFNYRIPFNFLSSWKEISLQHKHSFSNVSVKYVHRNGFQKAGILNFDRRVTIHWLRCKREKAFKVSLGQMHFVAFCLSWTNVFLVVQCSRNQLIIIITSWKFLSLHSLKYIKVAVVLLNLLQVLEVV